MSVREMYHLLRFFKLELNDYTSYVCVGLTITIIINGMVLLVYYCLADCAIRLNKIIFS